jgi:mycothiol synthase
VKDLSTAPLTPADAGEVTRVGRACEIHDDGAALFTEEDFVASCNRPSMDLERHSVGVRDGNSLVAFAILHGERGAFAYVLPAHRGREPRWEGWFLDIELAAEPARPELPPGYTLREFVPGRDVHRVIEVAFGEWPDAEACPFEDWVADTLERPGFPPELIGTVAQGGEVVGVASLNRDEDAIWVGQLGVARAHRGRGLARALYEHVGMHVTRTHWEYAKRL